MGFPGGSTGKESACNVGNLGSILGMGRSPGEGKGYPLQYSGLENLMDYIVHGVAKSQTRLSNFHYTRGKVLEVTNHPVFFSAAVVSKEDTAAPLLPGALEFSVWETSITAFSNTTWD